MNLFLQFARIKGKINFLKNIKSMAKKTNKTKNSNIFFDQYISTHLGTNYKQGQKDFYFFHK